MQLKKLAFICNACFWLTLFFQLWKGARNLHPQLLNTIVMLGTMALIANFAWLASYILKRKKERSTEISTANFNNSASGWLFNSFNLLSFIVQLILLYFKFL